MQTTNKARLLSFISKYNLGDLINSAKWSSDGNKIQTSVFTSDRTMLGIVEMSSIHIPSREFGVFNTNQLVRLLAVLGDTVDISIVSHNNSDLYIKKYDLTHHVNNKLDYLNTNREVTTIDSLPEWDITLKLDGGFYTTFNTAVKALSQENKFTILNDDGQLKVVVGHSRINSNRVTIDVAGETELEDFDPMSFRSDYFLNVLKANGEIPEVTYSISTKGISYLKFEAQDFKSEYYLTQLQTEG